MTSTTTRRTRATPAHSRTPVAQAATNTTAPRCALPISDPSRFGLLPDGSSPFMDVAELAAVIGSTPQAIKAEASNSKTEGRESWLPRRYQFGTRRGVLFLRSDVAAMVRPIDGEESAQ